MIDFLNHHAGLIGLIFFFGFFIAMLVWVLRPGMTKKFEEFGNIPLKEKDHE